jgi:uncharacterized protein YndB with AHSA1/START domain
MTTDLSLRVTQHVPARPERVFDAWLDPAMIHRFMIASAGQTIGSAQTDPKVGGAYRIVMKTGTGDVPHWGEYREISRPGRLVFTWNSPHGAPGSVVTLTFEPDGQGTMVTLVQDLFVSEGSRDGHIRGWTSILATMAETDI